MTVPCADRRRAVRGVRRSALPRAAAEGEAGTAIDESAYVSLFSGGGIGDLGIARDERYGANLVAACERDPHRAALLSHMHPQTRVFASDINQCADDLIEAVLSSTVPPRARPWLCVMSPPCQGMSSNGMGRINTSVRSGTRKAVDDRNALFIPGLSVALTLRPVWIVVENVPGMRREPQFGTRREGGETSTSISDAIESRLRQQGYTVHRKVVDFADWGVPQRRKRLLIVARSGDDVSSAHRKVMPDLFATGSQAPSTCSAHVCLKDAIWDLPPLHANERLRDDQDPWHVIPRLSAHARFCVQHTPEGGTAMENTTCVACGHENGRAPRDKTSPHVECAQCGATLPRPQVKDRDGSLRLVRAFGTSYRRMRYDSVANTVTTTSGVASSDVKLHPTQCRVLSVREVMRLCTVSSVPAHEDAASTGGLLECAPWHGHFPDPDRLPGRVNERCVREVLGECIPPLVLCKIARRLREYDATGL